MERLKEIEKLLTQCENDFIKLKQINREIKRIEQNRKKLDEYYTKQYIKDYEKYSAATAYIRVLDQDSIWNTLNDQYYEKIKILKTIIKSI